MALLNNGRYAARIAENAADTQAAQRLRYKAFCGEANSQMDVDEFDDLCTHFLIEDRRTGALVCCFRLMLLPSGQQIGQSYSAQFYDLSNLSAFAGRMAELGRFCSDPIEKNPDILRIAWGAMTSFVDEHNVELLFGCSSFHGTNSDPYAEAFALLKERHLAPTCWLPRIKAAAVFRFARQLGIGPPDTKAAMQHMPPLLRTYLSMGGWVSDHAVIDEKMNTLHVFTGLEIGAIPAARKRLLRAVAQPLDAGRVAG